MHIATNFPDDIEPGFLAWFVSQTLTGIAIGCFPSFLKWQLPPLYHSGVRYRLEPAHGTGREEFALPRTVYRRKWGDCDDLVIWGLCEAWAEQRIRPQAVQRAVSLGAAARAWVAWEGNQLHATIRLPDGAIEDPSKELGG